MSSDPWLRSKDLPAFLRWERGKGNFYPSRSRISFFYEWLNGSQKNKQTDKYVVMVINSVPGNKAIGIRNWLTDIWNMSISEERIFVAWRIFSELGPDIKPYILVPSEIMMTMYLTHGSGLDSKLLVSFSPSLPKYKWDRLVIDCVLILDFRILQRLP